LNTKNALFEGPYQKVFKWVVFTTNKMKEVGVCDHCGRNVYVNSLDLCKRCNLIVGVESRKQAEAEAEPEEEEQPMSMEELGITPESKEEGKEEEKKEEEKSEEKEESKEEKKE